MSFICSRALGEAFSQANCLDIDASVPSSGSPTPRPCLWHAKTMEPFRFSRFGMTCKPLTDDRGAALLTWWLEDSRVRTSLLPGKAQGSPGSDQECGPTWRASLAKFDPVSRSWKTVQLSLLGDSELSSVTWPRSGMTAGGQCWELPMSEPRTNGAGYGSWPTPCATDSSNRKPPKNVHISAAGLPKHIAQNGEKSQMRLSQAVQMWPTPTVCGNHNRKGASATSGDGHATAVKMWPTPTAHNAKETNAKSEAERNTPTLAAQVGGQLNPNWVEWLMGWPIGHTDLKPLGTDKSPNALPKPGESLAGRDMELAA